MYLTRIFYAHGIDRRSTYVVELMPIKDTNMLCWVLMLEPVGPLRAPTDFSIATCLFATRANGRDYEVEIDLPKPVRHDTPLEGKRGLVARVHRYVEGVIGSAAKLKKVRPTVRKRLAYDEFKDEAFQEFARNRRKLKDSTRRRRHCRS